MSKSKSVKTKSNTVAIRPRPSRRRNALLNIFGQEQGIDPEVLHARRAYETAQIPDPFKSAYTTSFSAAGPENILPPPTNPYTLLKFPNENNTLRQCIDAMVVNVESMGHRLEYVGPEGSEDAKEMILEKARYEALLDQPNGEYGIIELRERLRRDKETFGYNFTEICRSVFGGEIVSYYHVPAHTIRLTTMDKKPTEVSIWLMRDGKYIKQKIQKRFRRYVQEVGNKKTYFKEFGDPRKISSRTGLDSENTPDNELATELYMSNLYSPGTPYGAPRWINQLPAIMGSRESELTNLQFFKDNAIPAMAVMVSGGNLTANSVEEIEELIYSVQGRNAIHRVMILEAEGNEKAASTDGKLPAPKIDIKPLAGDRQADALFQDYDKQNQIKIRSSFRIPPIFIGLSEDLTHATANASLVMAESQVFGPERNKVDDFFNFVILSDKEGKPPTNWAFRSNPPRISDPATMVDALTVFDEIGALTPNIAIGIANELFDLSIASIVEAWGDYPFSITTKLLERGELVGLEAIRNALEGDRTFNSPKLNPDQNNQLNDKVIEPLKKLLAVKNVQDVRVKKRKRRTKR